MFYEPKKKDHGLPKNPFNSLVIPRPIGWISSIDLENAVLTHENVLEACVVGVPHPKWDERPLLFLITKDGNEMDKQEINDFLLQKVVKWWLPDDIIFVKELPHGATGKLLKVELREEYKEHLMEK